MRIWPGALGACALLCFLLPMRVDAQVATPLSSGTLPAGKVEIAGFVGFPFLSVQAGYGLGRRFDLTLVARTAWEDIQRIGLQGRIRISNPDATSGFTLRLGLDTWTGRPKPRSDGPSPWIDITGLQDVTGSVHGIESWTTPRGSIISALAGVDIVGTRQPPAGPLSGVPPFLAFGPNLVIRLAAEVPYKSGLVFSFDLGVDVHFSGFDSAVAMPEFSIGIGYAL